MLTTYYAQVLALHPMHCEAAYNLVEAMYQAGQLRGREAHELDAAACIQMQLRHPGAPTIHPLQALRFLSTMPASPAAAGDALVVTNETAATQGGGDQKEQEQGGKTAGREGEGAGVDGEAAAAGEGGGTAEAAPGRGGRGEAKGQRESVLTCGAGAIDELMASLQPSEERGLRLLWPPAPHRPIRQLVVGYMSASFDILPLVASRALSSYDPDRTVLQVFALGRTPLSPGHAAVYFGEAAARCCVHQVGSADAKGAAAAINAHQVHVLVDFDAGVAEQAAAIARERPAPVQVRGWGSLWPTSAHVTHLPRLAIDRITAPPEFVLDWSESLVLMPRMLSVPPLWAGAGLPDRKLADRAAKAIARRELLEVAGDGGREQGDLVGHARVLGFTGETVQLSADAVEIWREILEHPRCASAQVSLAVTDYMRAHEEVAAEIGGEAAARVVGWPAQQRADLAALSDVVVDAPCMSATLGTVLTQVASAVAGGGVPFVTVAGRSACTRQAAAALVSAHEGSVLGSSLARIREEMPELTCRMLARDVDAFSAEARAVVKRRVSVSDESGRMWERAARVLLDLAEADEEATDAASAETGGEAAQRRCRRDFHVIMSARTGRDFSFIPLRM